VEVLAYDKKTKVSDHDPLGPFQFLDLVYRLWLAFTHSNFSLSLSLSRAQLVAVVLSTSKILALPLPKSLLTPPSPYSDSAVVILDLADPYKPVQLANLTMGSLNGETGYGAPNSVAAFNGYIAVAMDAQIKTNPGFVRLYSLVDGFKKVGEVMVAAMPDMVSSKYLDLIL
jgi:hypothetical protein